MTFATSFQSLIDLIQKDYLGYFIALAGLGVLTMAVLQAVENLVPVRYLFHRWTFRRWLKQRAALAEVQQRILVLAADGNEFALYDAKTEEFFRNLEVVVQLAVDYPLTHSGLLDALSTPVIEDDIKTLKKVDGDRQSRMDARDRVRQQLAQSLNALRLSTASKWMNGMHMAAFALSLALACYALWLAEREAGWWPTLGSAAIAAFLAPVAHDLVDSISKPRSKK